MIQLLYSDQLDLLSKIDINTMEQLASKTNTVFEYFPMFHEKEPIFQFDSKKRIDSTEITSKIREAFSYGYELILKENFQK